ncbi:MAG: hypothetical protein IJ072_08370, partial [Oscillospiraceae bacterium]|nr:hypothetical protein [Oscillospiraceae bacterium]
DLALLLPGISRDTLEKTLLGFYRRGFAEIVRPDGRSYQKYRAKARGRCLFRPIPFFDAHPRFRDFIYNALVCGSPIVFILGLMAFINAPFGLKLPRSIFELAFALIALILSLFIHEFSHAAVAHKKGALPAEIGVKLSGLFIPCTYVIYAGIKTVAEPRDRLLIFTAGVMSHGLFLGLAAILHRIFNLTPLVYIFYINLIALLLNAVPLPGTDGYSVLREYRRKNKKDTGK